MIVLAEPEIKAELPLPAELLPYLGFVLSKATASLQGWVNAELAGLRLDFKQVGFLALLYLQGPQSQIELGRKLRIDRTTVVGMVDDLEAKGYLERQPDPHDRRAYRLVLTPSGRRAIEQAEKIVLRTQEEFLSPLKPGERETLLALLRRLI
ncbi:MAG: MarR family winged helix-turn-helix transcriptional regulator [Deinococcota bacterium]